MIIKELINIFEEIAPQHYAEDFDNTGLLVGNPDTKVKGILVTLDTLETVVEEAIQKKCNVILSFHPIIFSGLKKITGKNYVEKTIIKAIQNNIAIYAIHTALDNAWEGVSHKMAEILKLQNVKTLIPKQEVIKKLTTYVPKKNAEQLRNVLFNTNAGVLGNYENCSFNIEGLGTYKANKNANPTLGKIGKLHTEEEVQINITFLSHLENKVLKALKSNHPYEEVAYEVITLKNTYPRLGMGKIGALPKPLNEKQFLNLVKKQFNCGVIKHSSFTSKIIKNVAVLGGSGSFAITNAKAAGADAYLTADLKYHDFFQAENNLLLADIGHFESEQYTKQLLFAILTEKISNFAPALSKDKIVLSKVNTNPISYF